MYCVAFVTGIVTYTMSTLVQAIDKFGVDLFKNLLKESSDGNISFSPLTISAALSMVYLGAHGETAKQMERVGGLRLHFCFRNVLYFSIIIWGTCYSSSVVILG